MLNLDELILYRGKHAEECGQYCVMEATAAYLNLPHADRNIDDVDPRIENYARALNDVLPNEERQKLKTFIPRLPNTRSKNEDQDNRRRWLLQETSTKVFAALSMQAIGLNAHYDTLKTCSITNLKESAAWAAEAAGAARAARAAEAAGAARAAWAAEAAGAAEAAEAAGAAGAAVYEEAFNLLDALIKITENDNEV